MFIPLLGGLFLLLVRLLFKETSFRKKSLSQKARATHPAAQPFVETPVGLPTAGMPANSRAFIPTDAQGAGTRVYPTPANGNGISQLNPTLDQPYGENLSWEADPTSQPDVMAETTTNWGPIVREFAETIVLTLLIFLIMRALIQNYRIEGYSMEPNLHEQQYLIVNKVAYYLGEPQRGDIIVFEYPNDPTTDYIKRVIGVPGDTVECRANEILVNGQVIDEPYGPHPWNYICPPQTLAEDEYFVLGDNRSQSSDSHKWGPLERKFIIGKAWISYWPMDSWGPVANYPIQAPDPDSPVAQTQ
ncbi:MAG: signal peptidase I [Ardenticatenaceae bacterium]